MHFDVLKHDIHSHLLPGLDDGVQDMETALAFIRQLSELGYTHLTTTPHIMCGVYNNGADTIMPKLDQVREAVRHAEIAVELNAGAEYLMDDYFESLLEDRKPLLTIAGNHVLVEFSWVGLPAGFRSTFFNMKMAGYEPILAHPERYHYLHKDFDVYREIHATGVRLQANLLSFTGYYGSRVQAAAVQMAEEGLLDFTGTDLHHQRHMQALTQFDFRKLLGKMLAVNNLRNALL
ncbi:CpsB/CapC family capsule biosynthesis tyrosine phosphatase [Chitinophaga pollutisoli]|uniref:protein-tyrosine-phosphatase n=1 Tax=Chitinophaga pollutisoli TaxID=3133966 RepID=A0ABZ2YI37_9BACT